MVLRRAAGRCEWPGCDAIADLPHPLTGARVILQVAHWDHNLKHNGWFDLYAFCQLHHNLHDRHQRQRARFTHTQQAAEAAGQQRLKL